MKKILYLLTLAIFLPLSAKANVFLHPAQSVNLLNIKNSIPQPEIVRGNFKQTKLIKDLNKNFISSGKFLFSKERGIYWDMQKPFSIINSFTKEGLITNENGKKTLVEANKSPAFKEISDIFQLVFTADVDKLKDHFEIFFTKNKESWMLGLKSKNEAIKSVATKITITGNKFVSKIILEEEGGDLTTIEFSNLNQKPLSKSEDSYFKL